MEDASAAAVGEVISLAAARGERAAKKSKAKNYHVVLGQALLEVLAERGERVVYEGGMLRHYRGGLWETYEGDQGRDWLGMEIQAGCKALEIVARNALVAEVYGWIKRELYQENIPWDQHGKIPTRSGLLDLTTLELEPLKPEHYATYRIECDFNEKAKCPWWLRMLADCFDQPTVDVLQEVLGAALIANKPRAMMRALLLYGKTHSGKSNIVLVMAYLFGSSPIMTPFDILPKDHGTMPFARHTPWVLLEAFEQSAWHPNAIVKALLAGEPIGINPKGDTPFTHVFKGPIFWASNWPPRFKDASRAMANRMLIVHCHAQFEDEKPMGAALEARRAGYDNPHDLVLSTERSGILNWALIGLKRLQQRGHFDPTPEMRQELQKMETESNFVTGFLAAGCAELDENTMVSSADLCGAITMWHSTEHGEDSKMLSNKFIGVQINAAYDDKLVNYKSDGVSYYIGIRLTKLGEQMRAHMMGMGGKTPLGKLAAMSGQEDEVNKKAPVSLQQARVMRSERRAKSSVLMSKR